MILQNVNSKEIKDNLENVHLMFKEFNIILLCHYKNTSNFGLSLAALILSSKQYYGNNYYKN